MGKWRRDQSFLFSCILRLVGSLCALCANVRFQLLALAVYRELVSIATRYVIYGKELSDYSLPHVNVNSLTDKRASLVGVGLLLTTIIIIIFYSK